MYDDKGSTSIKMFDGATKELLGISAGSPLGSSIPEILPPISPSRTLILTSPLLPPPKDLDSAINSVLHKPFVFKLTCKEDGVHIVNDIGSLDLVSESTLLLSKILQAQFERFVQ